MPNVLKNFLLRMIWRKVWREARKVSKRRDATKRNLSSLTVYEYITSRLHLSILLNKHSTINTLKYLSYEVRHLCHDTEQFCGNFCPLSTRTIVIGQK